MGITAYTFCDGTLISTRQVLTAAHCIPTAITFMYMGVTYTIPIITNNYYPTMESMLAVYLGVHNISSIQNDGTFTAPTVQMSVMEARKVRLSINLFKITYMLQNCFFFAFLSNKKAYIRDCLVNSFQLLPILLIYIFQ